MGTAVSSVQNASVGWELQSVQCKMHAWGGKCSRLNALAHDMLYVWWEIKMLLWGGKCSQLNGWASEMLWLGENCVVSGLRQLCIFLRACWNGLT